MVLSLTLIILMLYFEKIYNYICSNFGTNATMPAKKKKKILVLQYLRTLNLQWILHDWSDEHCLKLLKNCWKALPNSGKVILVEYILPVVPENNVSSNIVFEIDLFMLAQNPGGKERSQKDFEELAVKSGFSGCEVICCAYNGWVMEFHKTADL